jgi:hypothetical protein
LLAFLKKVAFPMKKEKKPINDFPSGCHTGHPVSREDLNEQKLRELEEGLKRRGRLTLRPSLKREGYPFSSLFRV